ncbi:membrane protein [Bradyrhizobium sp. SSBR45G]|uniref:TadE/TadG family type IV pilus assembly protein n=1 Tax=unclassified Bradyrhizobium TaxID=2631580 RepID=UPI0023429951|nr:MULTISPECIES: TadE/TadG family type IV pilus assembly protein [unclassified Bradyrhizobium]GLH77992.1 membrane protein [Bradyrhizobium sp. SSBR45G]GLH88637.1 membrane protein [Bradyrhizobium sp. SSBR45R]
MHWLLDHLRRFGHDQRGNIAILFAITCVPVLAFVGAGVDYSMANRLRAKLQLAIDEAVLAGVAAGKAALDSGASQASAIAKAQAAASSFFAGNTAGISATPTITFTASGRTLSGVGSTTSVMNTSFMRLVGFPTMTLSAQSTSSATMQPYLNVYLLVDISSSMLLPATQAGITQMNNGTGCTLACHETTDGTDSYSYALKNNVLLRYQVVNQGVQNLLTYLNSSSVYKNYVKVGLWSFDNQLTQMSPLTSSFTSVANNFPAPGLAYNDAAAATPFDSLISSFVASVGTGGDGSTSGSPQKMVIIATDGVNDPTRAWTSQTSLRSQVRVFNTSFCNTFKSNGVTIAIINTPYYPMTWDWGYNATLGQPGSLGGATRVDDIPIALKSCAGSNFMIASDVATIQNSFTTLFNKASPVRLTN